MTAIDEHYTLLKNLALLDTLEDMTPDDRLRFVYAVSSVFCLSCGKDSPPNRVCNCLNDE